jgi:hypothetical protein
LESPSARPPPSRSPSEVALSVGVGVDVTVGVALSVGVGVNVTVGVAVGPPLVPYTSSSATEMKSVLPPGAPKIADAVADGVVEVEREGLEVDAVVSRIRRGTEEARDRRPHADLANLHRQRVETNHRRRSGYLLERPTDLNVYGRRKT